MLEEGGRHRVSVVRIVEAGCHTRTNVTEMGDVVSTEWV